MKEMTRTHYTQPTAEVSTMDVAFAVLQSLSGSGTLGGWLSGDHGSIPIGAPSDINYETPPIGELPRD